MYEYICLVNINKIYTSSGKCDYQLQFKEILESSMVSTPERFIYNSPMSPRPPMIVKKFSAKQSLRLFTEVLDVQNKTSARRVGAAKSNHDSIRAGIMLWSSIPNELFQPQMGQFT